MAMGPQDCGADPGRPPDEAPNGRGSRLVLANVSNGLAFPHDDICYFQSNHAHQLSSGYFARDAMPLSAVVHLLRGGELEIVDATRSSKRLTDAQRLGVATWCLVFNRAVAPILPGARSVRVCPWQTREMARLAMSQIHRPTAHTIRKLGRIFGAVRPAVIGENVLLTCHSGAVWDDQPLRLQAVLGREWLRQSA